MNSREEVERQAFQLIHEAGREGILQIEMWRTLETDTRVGSRIALKFLKKGVIKRLKELHEGHWTYRLISLRKPVTVDSIIDCPCMACNDIERCTPGLPVSSLHCGKLTYWIDLNTDIERVQLEELHEDNI